ncbi:MAG: PBP1A family penicillin-binding protein [Patescibacteria group bacterium]
MARKKKITKVPKLTNLSKAVLINIGKPLYLVIEYTLIGLLLTVSAIGKIANLTVETISSNIRALPKYINKLTKKKKLAFSKLSLPKFVFLLLFLITILSLGILIFKDLPSPRQLTTRQQVMSTKIYDRNGVLLYKIYKDENRTPIKLADVPSHVRYATLAAEDAEFYSHPGFSLRGIGRSIYKNATQGERSGGSTITQQLVKNALLSPEKTLVRKVKEILLSVETEMMYTKNEIFEMYLNEVSYGGSAYGIEEASQVYFGKSVRDISLGEASLLAGLPKSPTRFSPFGSNPENSIQRQKDVLHLMVVNKFIKQEDADKAAAEQLKFVDNKTDIKAPHFVMYVREKLVEKYGEEMVEQGGLEVYTTLDYNIQKLAEESIKTEVEKLSRLHVTNGASVVLDVQTGDILAMVGSKDYFDTKNDGNVNVTTRLRQPGSSIKVLNYAYALGNGYTPSSILQDTPVTFNTAGQPPYAPKNYDGTFKGPLTIRDALAQSRNIPAVRLLASYGVEKMIDLGEKMGINTWKDRSRFGLSLTLGGGEVKLLEVANLFATVANYGKKTELMSITKVTNYKNDVLEQNTSNTTEVLDPRVAYQLIDILKDNGARSPAFGSNSALVVRNHPEVAVKTGTSNDLRDNLTLGFNQKYLVAVWVGNNDGSPMSRIASGITGAAPIWNKIIFGLLAQEKTADWIQPEGLVKIPICTLTGTLACQGCPTRTEWFLKEKAPTLACKKETIDKINADREKRDKNKQIGVGQLLPEAASTIN